MVIICPKGCEKRFDSNANLHKHLDQKIPCDSPLRIYPCDKEGCKHKAVSRQNRYKHRLICKGSPEPKTIPEWRKANDELSKKISSLLVSQTSDNREDPIGPEQELEHAVIQSSQCQFVIRSVTNIVDRRSGQFYFSLPPGHWTDMRRIGEKTNFVISELWLVIKIGYNGEHTGRHNKHDSEFNGISRIIDSLVSPVAAAAEIKIRDRLVNDGKLFSGKHEHKKSRDNELIIVKSQAEYEEYVALAQTTIKDIESSIASSDICMYNEWRNKVHMLKNMFSETQSLLTQAEQVTHEFESKLNMLGGNSER